MGVFKDFLKSLIRAALYALFAVMVRKGWITQEQADSWIDPMVIGIVGFLGVVLWALWDKHKSWLFGKLALQAPAGTSPETIKEEIKDLSTTEAIRITTAPPDGERKGE